MSSQATKTPRSPWVFVPSLYFLQGLPYFVVATATTVFFQRIDVSLETIGRVSSFITLPWMLKPLWSPLVDTTASKRAWTVAMQFSIVVAIGLLALATTHSNAFVWCTIACAWIALASATHDVACDGYYLLALDETKQAAFVGVRSACYRLARVFVSGGVVYLAGAFQESRANGSTSWIAFGASTNDAWRYAFACAAFVYAVGFAWGFVAMPRAARDQSAKMRQRVELRRIESVEHGDPNLDARGESTRTSSAPFIEALKSYFAKPGILGVLAFILLYRFGESMLTTMSAPFLLATVEKGGMALTEKQVGLYSGTLGVIALIVGGIVGGALIARFGARRCLWPMVIAMHAPNVLYAWAAFAHPGHAALASVIAIEQLGYGFGFAAYMVVLMIVSRDERFATTHYAISTGFMALGALCAGFISGSLVEWLGFAWFFVVVCLAGIPGMITLFFVPFESAPRRE